MYDADNMTVMSPTKCAIPAEVKRAWKGSRVAVVKTADSFLFKRILSPKKANVRSLLRKAGVSLTAKDIAAAIRSARA